MFEKFKKLTIEGGYFDEAKTFELFKTDMPISIVYGRNGSGKTSIAKAFLELSQTAEQKKAADELGLKPEFTLIARDAVPDDSKKSIFVFDEDFVKNKVKVEDKDGLNPIVMLGDQVGLDSQIKEKESELAEVEKILEEYGRLLKEYKDKNNQKSDTYHFNNIKQELQRDNGWADIDKIVNNHAAKTAVTTKLVKTFVSKPIPEEDEEALKQKLKADIEVFKHADNASAIVWNATPLTCPENLDEVSKLLQETVEKPELNDREKHLLSFLQVHPQTGTQKLLDEKWDFCPTCLRDINDSDRNNLSETLSRILNQAAEDFKKRLREKLNLFGDVKATMPQFPGELHKNELNEAMVTINFLNKILDAVRIVVEERLNKPYEPVRVLYGDGFEEQYKLAITEYKSKMAVLQQYVADFNKVVADRRELAMTIMKENNRYARKRFASEFAAYQQAKQDRETTEKAIMVKGQEKKGLLSVIAGLKTKKNNTRIALDYINQELQYVFYSDRKIQLEPGEGCYKLKVQGKDVLPHKISVGERNVLGLCYFFANIFQGKRDEKKYKSEYLLVIDDPVSSFDHGNRVGVMSLLRYQFNCIKKGNANSRILVMSHDLHSVFDMVKIRNEVTGIRGSNYLELVNKELKKVEFRNEYANLLLLVYQYATDDKEKDLDDAHEMGVGNIMRRMLEAFSTFCYCKGFEEMLRMEGLLQKIPADKQPYYENFMCRLALNGESHSEESTYTLNNIAPYITKEEKVQTAKSLLLFLMYVNEEDLKSYCETLQEKLPENEPNLFEVIKNWQEEDEPMWLLKMKAEEEKN